MTDQGAYEPLVRKILAGQLRADEIPEIPARVVRVFFSSTGADTVTERNVLVQQVYPQLREYCRQRYGVEFQIVDLDWGIPQEGSPIDHELAEFKVREIERCQSISIGPNFVTFIGQRYGERPLHGTILAEEFEVLRMVLQNHKSRDTRNAPLLDKWYIKDNNSSAPVYVLQPVGSLISEYNDEDENKKQAGIHKWRETEAEIRRLLTKAADLAYQENLIDVKHKYTMSGLDAQMLRGLEENEDPTNTCLIIFRDIVDLKNYVDDIKAPIFSEVMYNEKYEQHEIDPVAANNILKMRNRAQGCVPKENVLSYEVLWRYDDVINPKLHKEYLDKLCSQFMSTMKILIDRTVPNFAYDIEPEICEEALQHWLRCKRMASDFYGRDEQYAKLRDYLLGTFNQPMVIYGESGCGKSLLLSKLAVEAEDMISGHVINVVRFIGYTPRSKDLKQILTAICTQVLITIGRQPDEVPADFKDLQKFFIALLQNIPVEYKLVIYLDAIDRILPEYNAHVMSWLPSLLSRNVKIVLTTLPQKNNILDRLKQEIIRNDQALLEVPPLNADDGEELLNFYLRRYGRKVTSVQMNVFKSAFQQCSLPLFVRLAAEKARRLRSYDNIDINQLSTDVTGAVNDFFDWLEQTNGKEFVSRSMAYLVASSTGISDCEMEDLLSLDDNVLNSLYDDYHPPVRRVPFIKWLRLKDQIGRFLHERETDGVTVYCWRHDDFDTVVKARYLNDPDVSKAVHSMIADYFLGTWANKSKPIIAAKAEPGVLLLPCGSEADRQVPTQPLTFQYEGSPVRFNKRKYDQVPRHLYLAERLKELNQLVLFNYEWLYNKIKALSLQHIMADFALNPSVEASLVEEALRVAESVIERDINNMAPEIAGRLLPYYNTLPNIRALIHQCDTDGLKHCALMPNFPYLQVPGSSLQHTLDPPFIGEFFRLAHDDRYLLTKERDSSHIFVYDLMTGEKKSNIFASNGELYLTPNWNYVVIVDHVTEKAVKIHHLDTGAYKGQLIVLNHIELKPKERYKMSSISLTNDRICLTVTTDISYLCIADIETCKFLQIVGLDGRSEICEITPNGKYVFCNSNEFLLGYDLYSLQHVCTFSLGNRPNSLAFTKDGFRGFLTNEKESKLLIMHVHNGNIEMAYKAVLEEEMPDDKICGLKVSPKDDAVLVHGLKTLVVYSRFNEKVCAVFQRPRDIPTDFKLPKNQYANLNFSQAEFSRDGKFVIGTLFRNIYLWQISTGNLVTTIQAPVGVVKELLVSQKRSQIVTHIQGARDIQIWNIDEAVNQVNMLDRLTGPITSVQVTTDSTMCFIKCKNSDEIGVIDMQNGIMLDLLTHDSRVNDFAITPTGSHVLTTIDTKKKDASAKLWDVSERKIIKEFGNSSGYCISPHGASYVLFVAQKDNSFKSPYFITMMKFVGDACHENTHPLALRYVLSKPFLTANDKYLVVFTAQDYEQSRAYYDTPTICAFSMEEDMKVSYYTPESFQGIAIESIVDLKPCPNNPYTIAMIYKSKISNEINENVMTNGGGHFTHGLVILDICSGSEYIICEPFLSPDRPIDTHLVFANSFSFCLDSYSNLFQISEASYIGQIPNPGVKPQIVALNGNVILYYKGTELYAVRIQDGQLIAKCNVHSKLCHLTLCKDERTIIAGCEDGTIASYVLVDPCFDDVEEVIKNLLSRKVEETPDLDGRQSRTWDRIENGLIPPHSRPPSSRSCGPKDKVLLKKVKPVQKIRPKSDTLVYMNQNSKSCSVM